MSSNFNYDVLFVIQSGPELSSARHGIDMMISALSMDLPIALVLQGNGVNCIDANSSFKACVKKLPMLEDIFDLEDIFIADAELPDSTTLSTCKIIDDHQFDTLRQNAKHLITF